MLHTKNTFTGHDGLKLYYQSWRPKKGAVAVLIIVHGLGEHSGRYMNLVTPLVTHGYAIYAFDNRGHGRSAGQRGHVQSFSDLRQDLALFQQLVKEQEGERPLFIMGHSLGGLIVLDTVLRDSTGYKGVIASSPALDTGGVSAALMTASKILSRVWPTLSFPSGLEVNAISRDSEEVQAYLDDSLVHDKGTPRLAIESQNTIVWCQEHADNLQIPILIIHGSADRITSPVSSREFFDKITFADKTYIDYEGGYHESLNDIHQQEAAADIEHWLNAHL
ncbi:MAG: alpha/beta hydrolase [Anaerolineae bacterium]|nr:alpha/beta hydrolase [Anaerolineae bacterium]